ncbi:MAG TPA: DUF2089 domain-containing protein [Ktedonobacterales bacterium]|nr:DUF2089 domain-containing protein [Ktedonobacterales bacterium]
MPQIHDVDGRCPVCSHPMTVTRLSCSECGSALEGSFRLTGAPAGTRSGPLATRAEAEARFGRLVRLDRTQLEFVETFLRCRGVIKNVEDMLGISYPTVKARLANVLDTLGFTPADELPPAESRARRREILADLAAGRITADEAQSLLMREASGDTADDDGAN